MRACKLMPSYTSKNPGIIAQARHHAPPLAGGPIILGILLHAENPSQRRETHDRPDNTRYHLHDS